LHVSIVVVVVVHRKTIELDEELKVVGNNMKSLEVAEQEVQYLASPWSLLLSPSVYSQT